MEDSKSEKKIIASIINIKTGEVLLESEVSSKDYEAWENELMTDEKDEPKLDVKGDESNELDD